MDRKVAVLEGAMSLHAKAIAPVPEQTARIAHAAFPKGNPYLTLGDRLSQLFEDETFADLYPQRGQPAQAPWRLALITLLQFAEDLSDRQAADAVRARIDWKYALALDLDDPGFDASVLCEFRARLLAGEAERRLLDTLLDWCRKGQLLKAGGKQRTDSTHVLAAVRAINKSSQPSGTGPGDAALRPQQFGRGRAGLAAPARQAGVDTAVRPPRLR